MDPERPAVAPESTTVDREAGAAAEQAMHAHGCGICLTVVHALFAVAWRGGSPGARAGEMASIIGRGFCTRIRTMDPEGDKASPAELAGATDGAVSRYLDTHGAHVADHAAFRSAIAQTIAAALQAAGEVTIHDEPAATRH